MHENVHQASCAFSGFCYRLSGVRDVFQDSLQLLDHWNWICRDGAERELYPEAE